MANRLNWSSARNLSTDRVQRRQPVAAVFALCLPLSQPLQCFPQSLSCLIRNRLLVLREQLCLQLLQVAGQFRVITEPDHIADRRKALRSEERRVGKEGSPRGRL